jgi:hypothetical protein
MKHIEVKNAPMRLQMALAPGSELLIEIPVSQLVVTQ